MGRLIIFDVDGTLLDSTTFSTIALNKSLEALGFEYRVTDQIVKKYLGCTGEAFYAGVLGEEVGAHWEKIREYNRKYNGDIMLRYGQGFEGVKDTFRRLKNKGNQIALYSNCSRLYMDRAIQVVGIEQLIDYHECVKDHGIEKPELIHKIMSHFQTKDAVVVGDRIHDYEAAKANKIPCIGVMYGYGESEMDVCHYKLYEMSGLVQLLKEIG